MMSGEQRIAMYENALNNYKPTIANLESQLLDENITAERKKDIESQLENAKKQVEEITEALDELKKEVN